MSKDTIAISSAGHRKRLRERLFEKGGDTFSDYELLELLLCSAIPRQDVKQKAKALLKQYGDLWTLLTTKADRLRAAGISETVAATLLVTGAVALRAHKTQIMDKPLLQNWQKTVDYCRASLGHEQKEVFKLLFLDRKNNLIADEIHQRGTIDHTPVYPREVVQRALELGAGALILVHNHPSGDPDPSSEDVDMTDAIVEACRPLGIVVHDHLIVGRGGKVASFKELNLL